MSSSVDVAQAAPGQLPVVILSDGTHEITAPWRIWEMHVHRASHLFVLWALAHPHELAQIEAREHEGATEYFRTRRLDALRN